MDTLEEKFRFTSYEKERRYVETLLTNYLNRIRKPEYIDQLNYIMKEIITNAEKANLKRIFFEKSNLNIKNPSHYEIGIKRFREQILSYYEEYIEKAEEEQFYIEFKINNHNNNLSLEISNNSEILPVEIERIKSKFQLAARFKSMEDVFEHGLDETEGAGFGIILSILILRKLGLDEKAIQIFTKDFITVSNITIPLNLINAQKGDIIAEAITNEVNAIPQFPQHIIEVINVLNNPDSTFKIIGNVIEKDPAFIAELLKTANSAIYSLPNKVENATEAVRLIGVRGIKNFVFSYSTNRALMNKYNITEIKIMMKHATEVAFIATELSKIFNLKTIHDNIFVCAMLHDLGKIIVRGIKPELVQQIQTICFNKGINNFMVESLTDGYNHSIIGSKLAEKWNFPDFLVETIKYHHIPLEAKDENIKLVSLIYLSDALTYYIEGKLQFKDIDYKVLKIFNIETKELFAIKIEPVIKKFSEIKNKLIV